ncbi:HAD family hydrolase [Chlorogloeopsis fritschii PCC 9212]|uniref:Cation-transporting ATPase n=1 Tax=Chlorogloeopsis fritschii PCC 6912 TaxID=211165 RepID=A0A3S0XS53_CHLFR|nr:HAD family hydrolase [Chlorogloeopsis fritschii]RUR75752.1 cation-transporting ATPase [Chlorogloeopsis fritschii PCC 6912]
MSYQVVHSTFGRYRIRIPQLAHDSDFASKLKALVESLVFVTEVRINAQASSLIVSYQDNFCSTTALEKFVSCIQAAADCVEISLTEFLLEGEDLKPEVNQWKDLGFPALSLTLALLAAPLELPPLIVILAIAGAATPWFNRAADSLLNQHQPNIDLLDSAWMTMQTVQGQFIAPALKTVLVEVRRTLRGNTTQTREEQSFNLLNELDRYVWVELEGEEQQIHISNLQQGDRMIVKSGEMILVDGIVVDGYGLIDTQNLTGNSTPIVCSEGQDVFASSILLEGRLCVLVNRIGLNTRAGLAALLAELAPVHDTKIGAFQAEFVTNAILPTLALGGTIYLMTGNIGAAISPYQFDFGSGIPISISTTVLQALIYAVRHGIYIRSGGILEALAHIDAIVFDIDVLALDSPETMEAIAILQSQNIDIYLVSGVPESIALDVATQLGVHPHYVCAEVPFTQKINLIRGLQHQGKTVAFVGDGEDEAVRLACAHVSISFAKTSQIPDPTTDVVILEDDLRGVTHAIAIAKRAMEIIYENTATIVIPNLFMQIGGGMFLGVNPVYNVIVNNGTAFVAEFLNGSRPLFETNFLPPLKSSSQRISQGKSNGKALKQGELAKRLGVSSQSLTSKRLKPEFPIWTQARDPEGIAWNFDPVAKRYRHSPA